MMASKKRVDSKGRVLRNGEMQRSSDGRYLFRYVDCTGKKKTIYALTLPELREKEKSIRRDLEDGIDRDGAEMTLNELFEMYMETKTGLRASTKVWYMSAWKNNVESQIGNMKIKNIRTAHIRSLYAEFTSKGLCEGTSRSIHRLISGCLEMATESDMIRKNPAKNCSKYIVGGKHDREALTREEQAEFISFVEESNVYKVYLPFITFMLNTGLRVSEQCGLRWKDIDMKKNVIHVTQQLTYKNYGDGCKYHVSDLKTENSERDIPLTSDARKALMEQKELDMALGVQHKEVEGIKDFIFVNTNGMPWYAGGIDAMLYRIVAKHNQDKNVQPLPQISAHLLRHTFASRAVEAGMDPKTLQMILGHSTINITMDIYVQMDDAELQRKFYEAEEAMKVG